MTWNEPDRTGGAAITDYQVQYGTAASGQARSVTDPSINWRLAGWRSASSARTKTITGLTNGTTYYVAVQARNDIDPADGDGALSEAVTAIPVAPLMNAPPTFDQASYSLNVRRDAPSGHVVATVAAMDAADDLVYRMSGTTSFAIESDSGQITTSGLLLGLASASYDMTVYVSDGVNAEVSVPVTVTLDPSPIVLTISGLDGVAGTMAIGDDTEVTVEGSHLVAGVRYSLNVTTSDTPKLGFSATCNQINAARELLSTSGTTDDADFDLHACDASAGIVVTATLSFGETVIATTSKTVKVKPRKPSGVRINGHYADATDPEMFLRWHKAAEGYTYEVRYGLECWSGANPRVCFQSSDSWAEPHQELLATETSGISGLLSGALEMEAPRDVKTLLRVEIRAKVGNIASDWSEPVFVYPTTTQPAYTTPASGDPVPPSVGTIPLTGFHPTHTYSYTICSNKFPDDTWVTEMQNAIRLIRETVTWYVGGENIIGSDETVSGQCATLVTEQIVDGATSIYTFAPPPFGEIRLADEDAQEFRHYCHEPENRIEKAACAGTPRPEGTPLPRFSRQHYIMFRRDVSSVSSIVDWAPGVNAPGAECSQFFQTAVHETGHAYGLGHAGQHVSIMHAPGRPRVDCVLSGYDVAALKAIYQSHVAE